MNESVAFTLIADDPYFYGEEHGALISDTYVVTTKEMVLRYKSKVWDVMGPPSASGTYTAVYAMLEGPDGLIYIAGDFTNFDNIANADNIVSYDPETDSYAALHFGATGIIRALAFNANGVLYVGGDFTNIGGQSITRLAKWNGSAWSALAGGAGPDGSVRALLFHNDGNLYFTGSFANAGGSGAVKVAYWDGSAYQTMGTGLTGGGAVGYALESNPNGNVFVGGDFTTANSVACAEIAEWDGTTFAPLAGGTTGGTGVFGMAQANNGDLLIAGDFTAVDSDSAIGGVARWNGSGWVGIGGMDTLNVKTIIEASDGKIWIGGTFSSSATPLLSFAPTILIFDGTTWHGPEVIGVGVITWALTEGRDGDIYTGHQDSAQGQFAGSVAISYVGTAPASPLIRMLTASAETNAVLYRIVNSLTGAVLKFDYAPVGGEILTIDLRKDAKTIVTSDMFGPVTRAMLPGSNISDFALLPPPELSSAASPRTQGNTITVFIFDADAGTTAEIVYRDTYRSAD